RIDIVDLEIAGSRDALRREANAQSFFHFDLRVFGIGEISRRRAAAEQLGLDLSLDQNVSRALRHRPVELVPVVRESNPRHVTDRNTAVLELRADIEALNRLVEVSLHRKLGLEPSSRADDDQNDHAGNDGPDDKQSELEVVGP